MPTWNGFIRSTAGAIESDSVAAQDLQERIVNDFIKVLVDNAVQQTVMQKSMEEALNQMVKNTAPHNQMRPVGGTA